MESLKSHAYELLAKDRYSVEILPHLTQCVNSQVKEQWYDCEINLAILKLYQFHPIKEAGIVDLDVLLKILVLALMRIPEVDFKLCLYLIPEQYQSIDSVISLTKLADALEQCQYANLWKIVEAKPEVLAVVAGLDTSFRITIFETICLAYQEMPIRSLCESLNLPQSKVASEFPGVKTVGDKFVLPSSLNNQPKPKTNGDSATEIQLPQIAQVLSNSLY